MEKSPVPKSRSVLGAATSTCVPLKNQRAPPTTPTAGSGPGLFVVYPTKPLGLGVPVVEGTGDVSDHGVPLASSMGHQPTMPDGAQAHVGATS